MKPKIWIFSIEPISTRYTQQWHDHFPELLTKTFKDKFEVIQVDGVQKNTEVTPGAFLNFSDTNFWKSSQLCNFLDFYNRKETTSTDHFIFTDAWNPTIVQLKYMNELLGYDWKFHGLWHAGSYDPQDFLGRIIGNSPWVRNAEASFFYCFDYNYFATEFHIDMIVRNLFKVENVEGFRKDSNNRIVRTGWPMEYMELILNPYTNIKKRNLILFPHRIAPEKQVDIFLDLKKHLPQYEFVVCQDQNLSKYEYHTLLAESKIVFSANLQETLGISCYEGALLNSIPMVPDRLSYREMYFDTFKYPSVWTESYETYDVYRKDICYKIIQYMDNYEKFVLILKKQKESLKNNFFNCSELLKNISK